MFCSLTTQRKGRETSPIWVALSGPSPFGCGSGCRWGVRRSCKDAHGVPIAKTATTLDTPTVAYEWDVVKLYTGLNKTSYKTYTNELDALTHTQVYELAQHLSLCFHF